MRPVLKKALLYLLIAVGLAVISASVIAFLNEDRIRSLVVDRINGLLETEARVESIEFSLLRKFPKASIRFNNLRIAERSVTKEKNALIEAKSVFLEFDPFDLLTGKYIIDEIQVDQGTIRITYFKDRSTNFDLFREDSADKSFQLSLEKVRLNNTTVIFENRQRGERFNAFLKHLSLHGKFDETVYDLTAQAKGEMQFFDFQAVQLNRPYPFHLDMVLTVNHKKNSYAFQQASLVLEELVVDLTGTYTHGKESGIDLAFRCKENKLSGMYDLLPPSARQQMDAYGLQGNLDINGKIKGSISKRHAPSVDIAFRLYDGKISHVKSGITIDDLLAVGTFTNGPAHSLKSSMLRIDSVAFHSRAGSGSGRFSLIDFTAPLLQAEASITADLTEIGSMLKTDSLETLSGRAVLSFSGSVPADSLTRFSKANLQTADITGRVQLSDVRFRWKGMSDEISGLQASLYFGDNKVIIDSLSCLAGKTALSTNGKLYNLFPFLFFDDERLRLSANTHIASLSLDPFLASGDKNPGGLALFFERTEAQLSVTCDDLTYRKFNAKNVRFELKVKRPVVILQDISFNAMKGLVTGWLQTEEQNDGLLHLKTQLTLDGIDVHELFVQCENFGQSVIVAQNLKGKAIIGADFSARLNREFSIRGESVHASARIDILNGELMNYQPVMALSKYIDIEELQHIRFSRLVNEIEIINRVVYIPEMEVKSSALELKLSGKHSFNNDIEYHFQLWLNDFLFRKAKRSRKNQTEFGDIESDESGRAKLFIRMEGTVENYAVKLDRKAMRKVWSENMKEERSELNRLFLEEFKGEKQEPKKAPKNFTIEWEGFDSRPATNDTSHEEGKSRPAETEKKKDSWLDKVGKPIKEEYQEYDPEKFD